MSLTLAETGLRKPERPLPVPRATWLTVTEFRRLVKDDYAGFTVMMDDGATYYNVCGKGCSNKFIGSKCWGKDDKGVTFGFSPFDVEYILVPDEMLVHAEFIEEIEDEIEACNKK